MTNTERTPTPIFDSLKAIERSESPIPNFINEHDYAVTREFLLSYRESPDTFHSYRRDVDRFLIWVALIARRQLNQVDRQDIENYIRFCRRPPANWITTKMVPRFIHGTDGVKPNPQWRPFVVKVPKEARGGGVQPSVENYYLSDKGVQATLRILSTFYSFLEIEDYVPRNPVKRVRQKSRLVRTRSTPEPIRRLTEIQWDVVIESAEAMASEDSSHERTLFIMSCLYGMYLRISELADTQLWSPVMHHFYQDSDQNWWFKTVGKGNKERDITVSVEMLSALKRYRLSRGMSALPSKTDTSPLIPKEKGFGGIRSTRRLNQIVQQCFDFSVNKLICDGLLDEADSLRAATVHWLRHTGISDDVKIRPKEHVRDDAGHSSSATTDRYIDIEKRERHASAKKKKLRPL